MSTDAAKATTKRSLENGNGEDAPQELCRSMENGKGDIHNGSQELCSKAKARCLESIQNEEGYFRCYADISIHEQMLADKVRTLAYKNALSENADKLKGGTVLDVGAGTGILSHFAVQAGATTVYAVEPTRIARFAEKIAKENNVESAINVIQSKIEDADLPIKVDALVSEWMGYCLLYESMLPSVLHARDKYLKPEGDMYPCQAKLFLAPVSDSHFQERLDSWKEMQGLYNVSMESLAGLTKENLTEFADNHHLTPESIIARPCQLQEFDLKTMTVEDANLVKTDFRFSCYGHNIMHGFAIWFTVAFPGTQVLDTSPFEPETHWGQSVIYLKNCVTVEQDTEIIGTYKMQPSLDNQRFWTISVDFTVVGTNTRIKQKWSCSD